MRLALVADSLDDETGIGRIVRFLAREFFARGHDVHVLGRHFTYHLNETWTNHKLLCSTGINSLDRILMRYEIPARLRALKPDVANSFMLGRGANVISAQSCHIAGIDILSKYGDMARARGNKGVFDRVTVNDERALLTSRHVRHVIAVSRLVKEQLCGYYGVKPELVTVVPNGLDLDLFARLRQDDARTTLRNALGLRDDEFVLLFIGNEFARKGLSTILRAMAHIHDASLRLVVVGGDNPAPFVNLAHDLGLQRRVTFMGKVAGPERYYGIAEAFVFPTLYEPFGMVITEAMAAGIPVITAKDAGAVEEMRHGVHGLFLDDPVSDEALALELQRLRGDDQLRHTLARNATEDVRRFSWNNVADATLSVYEQAC